MKISYIILWGLFLFSQLAACQPPKLKDFDNWQQAAQQSHSVGSLTLRGDSIQNFPLEEVLKMQNMQNLYIFYTSLTFLPARLAELKNLERLTTSDNQFVTLPDEIGQLQKLTSLYIAENQLQSLPASIGDLKNLKTLAITKPAIKEKDTKPLSALPSSIGKLSKLQHLIVSLNNLTHLPNEIGNLTSLELLLLGGERSLKAIPPTFKNLTKLKTLTLSNCVLLPESSLEIISQLPALRWLNIYSIPFKYLPESFAQLQTLTRLNISRSSLQAFPKVVCKLAGLVELDLYCKNIRQKPPEIAQLTRLQELTIDNDGQCLKIPPEIKQLRNLRLFKLNKASLTDQQKTLLKQWLPHTQIVYQ